MFNKALIAIAVILVVLNLSSCICATEIMEEKQVILSYDQIGICNELHFDMRHGCIDAIGECIVAITFYEAIGGRNYLFGKMIADHSPRTQNVVKVFNNTHQIATLSYVDILALPSVIQDSIEVFQFVQPN